MNTLQVQPPPGSTSSASPALARPAPVRTLKRILVPTDFSEESLKGIEYAIELAKQFDARLVLLHVVEEVVVPEFAAYANVVNEGELKQRMKARLDSLAERYRVTEAVEDVLVRRGTPYHEIARAAEDSKSDMIVIATHGYTGLKHVLLGSTTERVVRHARCPVLVVPAR